MVPYVAEASLGRVMLTAMSDLLTAMSDLLTDPFSGLPFLNCHCSDFSCSELPFFRYVLSRLFFSVFLVFQFSPFQNCPFSDSFFSRLSFLRCVLVKIVLFHICPFLDSPLLQILHFQNCPLSFLRTVLFQTVPF